MSPSTAGKDFQCRHWIRQPYRLYQMGTPVPSPFYSNSLLLPPATDKWCQSGPLYIHLRPWNSAGKHPSSYLSVFSLLQLSFCKYFTWNDWFYSLLYSSLKKYLFLIRTSLNKNKLSRPRNTFPLFRAAAMSPLSEQPPHHKRVLWSLILETSRKNIKHY